MDERPWRVAGSRRNNPSPGRATAIGQAAPQECGARASHREAPRPGGQVLDGRGRPRRPSTLMGSALFVSIALRSRPSPGQRPPRRSPDLSTPRGRFLATRRLGVEGRRLPQRPILRTPRVEFGAYHPRCGLRRSNPDPKDGRKKGPASFLSVNGWPLWFAASPPPLYNVHFAHVLHKTVRGRMAGTRRSTNASGASIRGKAAGVHFSPKREDKRGIGTFQEQNL